MSSNMSYQLPDLLGIIGSLELRTNRHCRFATETSEQWLQTTAKTASATETPEEWLHTATKSTSNDAETSGILSANELSHLRSTKIGLLCALCFPTCDAPQLRVLTDFVTLLFYSALRENFSLDLDDSEISEKHMSGLDLLQKHDLLRQIIDRRFLKNASAASEAWNTRFAKSVSDFHAAHLRRRQNHHPKDSVPSLEEYISFARELSGANMVLDLAELMEVFRFPDLHGKHAETITQLKNAALDVIAWSTDVVSYQHSKIRGNEYNLVTVLMHHNGLSVQGAMNLSGTMIKQAFSSFTSAERAILESLDKHKPLRSPVLSWAWHALTDYNPLAPSTSSSTVGEAEALSENAKRYIRALEDCVVGVVHWVYETELFFGKKGGEIRTFGWVFTDQIPIIPD